MESQTELQNFPEIRGMHYTRVLAQLHEILKPDWYLEVGTFRGRSLSLCQSNAIAVDPRFRLGSVTVPENARQFHFFQMTSDEFFAKRYLEKNDIKIDFAFLDGLHHFDALLRDFRETEKHMSKNGVIALHDCCPLSVEMTDREMIPGQWTGDVWKTVEILRRFRPDLEIEITTARPTGLAIVKNLDPTSRALDSCYDSAVSQYMTLENSHNNLLTYYASLDLVRPKQALARI